MNLIKVGDFCEVVNDKFTEWGVKRGHLVHVVGHRVLPLTEEDPYTQRIKFLVRLTDKEHRPTGNQLYLMDPVSILPVSNRRQKSLKKRFGLDADSID